MPERITDEDLINHWIGEADRNGDCISDGVARAIAAQLHNGMGSSYLALATTGAIEEGLAGEVLADYHDERTTDEVKQWLWHITVYRLEHGPRGQVDGWHRLWAEQPAEAGDATAV